MSHPSSLALEAFACGEEATDVAAHLEDCKPCQSFVEKLRALPAPDVPLPKAKSPTPLRRRKMWIAMSTVGIPLAAAAALFLLLRWQHDPDHGGPAVGPLLGALDRTGEEPTTSFKGSIQVAVIRERDGAQERFVERVFVREGDRLRVEVAVDREQAILAVVVGDDGSRLTLMPEAVRPPGTHYSERSARVSGPPSNGKIVVGDIEIPILWENGP